MGSGVPLTMRPAVVPRAGGKGAWGLCDICSDIGEDLKLGEARWLVAWDSATKWDYCQDCVNDALTADRILVTTGNLMNMRHPDGPNDIPQRGSF